MESLLGFIYFPTLCLIVGLQFPRLNLEQVLHFDTGLRNLVDQIFLLVTLPLLSDLKVFLYFFDLVALLLEQLLDLVGLLL